MEYCDSLFLDAYESGRDNALCRDGVEAAKGAGPESTASGIAEDRGTARGAPAQVFNGARQLPPQRHASVLVESANLSSRWRAGTPLSRSFRRTSDKAGGISLPERWVGSGACGRASFGQQAPGEIGSAEVGGLRKTLI
ncbi:hypothetical protein Trco_002606 [Trichoderma cornu-damae]|uniref:Uncharacterized protein n=1 Tax=Trichoderma cornu-damae TaxID=654480 RepID=A0A9P8QMZ6_9HYPO|nr:hypothetical protein Trco_002606 [Trichoderma cornu-damae]